MERSLGIGLSGELLCDKFPRLYSYVLDEDESVAILRNSLDLFSHFALPLSVEAYQELQLVSQLLLDTPANVEANDQRSFIWGSSKYSPSKFYNFLFEQLPTDAAFKALWKSRMLPKLKVFLWLLFHDRLNTRDLMLRKSWHLESGPNCVLCMLQHLETRDHLFLDCQFAKECWEAIGISWDLSLPITRRFLLAKNFSGPCFMEVVSCAAWNIWKVRNDLIFKGQNSSFGRWKVRFQNDLMLHQYKIKAPLVQPLIDWLLSIFI